MGLYGVPHPHRGSRVPHARVKQSGTNLSHPRASSDSSDNQRPESKPSPKAGTRKG